MAGCPVRHAVDPKLESMMMEYGALLPNCSQTRDALSSCRVRVAEASGVRRALWDFGIGRGHCLSESEELQRCQGERKSASQALMSKCSGEKGSLKGTYTRCLAQNKGKEECYAILEVFLGCAKKMAG
ncbi:hypothetical protein AAMO2058_000579400 [Amorphochlora amoebiformis]|uniref:Uncharacterized protein n=1 Tax=Amorphochlora amoebiformis TaxID=1561963 RepID=A0A7S0GQJ4_9EUKA|mmetsp:Transcript_11639/g.18440  ORF Transcript_11639/g.18440 Transcript_11639/m.18440 type:complete len:128 (+) Transcript_11639:14-397(+)